VLLLRKLFESGRLPGYCGNFASRIIHTSTQNVLVSEQTTLGSKELAYLLLSYLFCVPDSSA